MKASHRPTHVYCLAAWLALCGWGAAAGDEVYFPPPGESLDVQIRHAPAEAGMTSAFIEEIRPLVHGRWALWRHGYLVHLEGDFHDNYADVAREACFDAIGMRGWRAVPQQDGIRFHLDLEDMGRLGLLVLQRGRWRDRQIIPQWFVEQLERKQTGGARVNYDGPDDGRIDLDPQKFAEVPYGFMTWVNNDGDFYPGADRAWAWGAGAGGTRILWNRNNGVVFAAFGAEKAPGTNGIPPIIERSLISMDGKSSQGTRP